MSGSRVGDPVGGRGEAAAPSDRWTSDRSFDLYARLVQRVLSVPAALVAIVEADRLVLPGAVGLPEPWQSSRQTQLSHSFCQYVVGQDAPLIVTDARSDPRVVGNPAIIELDVVAYAGWPLTDHRGTTIGSLCAIDSAPREWTELELIDLADLAAACSAELAQRALADELETAVSELRRSNTQLTAFAAQVSHDLRNPLSALSSSLQMLEQAASADEVDHALTARLVDRARSSASRMSDLVNSVLAFAVVDGTLAVEDVDVGDVVTSVLDDLAIAMDGATVAVGETAPVRADPLQLRIVVQNLIGNALKHADGSSVEVSARQDRGIWALEVVDHGPGIPVADRRRVLEPFVRLDVMVAGSGLGLATCRRIAEAHGGRIEITETPGGGSTVRMTVPQAA